MKAILVPIVSAVLLLSACGTQTPASRSASDLTVAPQTQRTAAAGDVRQVLTTQYNVVDVKISVPKTLRVSEANMFYPIADIVWRGEPMGDRYAQVTSIYKEAATKAKAGMTKGQSVVVELEVTRFHCVTEKTRYTIGGTHSLHFLMTVRDATSGAVIDGPRGVNADVKAAGGALAVAEEQMGRTQRVVVVERLADVIKRELSQRVTDPLVVSRALTAQDSVAN